jgi:hypothetical protein
VLSKKLILKFLGMSKFKRKKLLILIMLLKKFKEKKLKFKKELKGFSKDIKSVVKLTIFLKKK